MSEIVRPSESVVREAVDPHGTLPYVELHLEEPLKQGEAFHRYFGSIIRDSEQVGYCGLLTIYESESMQFDNVTLNKTSPWSPDNDRLHIPRPKGLGLAVYVLAIETAHQRGLPFTSQGVELTPYSYKMWQILTARGVAEELQAPRKPVLDTDKIVYARYRSPQPDFAKSTTSV